MNIYELLEDNEQDVMAELHYPPEGALTGLFLMGFPSDRIYMAYDCGDCYYFRYLGNETFGIDTDLILIKHRSMQRWEKRTSCIGNRTCHPVN